jgi:hypothetical protein
MINILVNITNLINMDNKKYFINKNNDKYFGKYNQFNKYG